MEQTQKNPSHGQLLFPGPHIRATLESSSLQGHLTPFTTTCLALSPHPHRKASSLCHSCSIPEDSGPILHSTTEASMPLPVVHAQFFPTMTENVLLDFPTLLCSQWEPSEQGHPLRRSKLCYSTGIHCKEQEDGDWRTAECPAIAAFRNLPLMHSRSSLSPN